MMGSKPPLLRALHPRNLKYWVGWKMGTEMVHKELGFRAWLRLKEGLSLSPPLPVVAFGLQLPECIAPPHPSAPPSPPPPPLEPALLQLEELREQSVVGRGAGARDPEASFRGLSPPGGPGSPKAPLVPACRPFSSSVDFLASLSPLPSPPFPGLRNATLSSV